MPTSPDSSLRSFWPLVLLWLAGIAIRTPILAVPPVLPLIHDDLQLSETQVGLLIGLPSAMFAVAAVPGSLLVARIGVGATVITGLIVTALASAGRGAVGDVWLLYAATLLMGFGVAITQPALPRLVRDWMPARIGLGVAVYTNGMLLGATCAAALTIPLVLPLVSQSWRLGLVVWALPVALAAILLALAPRAGRDQAPAAAARWWPDWKSPLTWLLGLGFGCNNAIFFGCHAVLPDFLAGRGESDLIGPALGWLNGAQLLASFILLATGERLHRRAWPFVVFGALTLVAFGVLATGAWIVACAAAIGFAIAVTFVVMLALPAALSPPHEVQRTAAGMFTISYTVAVVIPTLSGALWDLTGAPWTAFVPLVLCSIALTTLGTILSFHRPRQVEPILTPSS
jgi:CP family cyanate transporter-like MFS transporter